MLPPIASPKPIGSRANDEPGHATRLVATLQLDQALHSTNVSRWSLGSCKRVQALDDISYWQEHVILPEKLPHGIVHTKELMILFSHRN